MVEYSHFLHQRPQLSPAAKVLKFLLRQREFFCWSILLGHAVGLQETAGCHLVLLVFHTWHQPLQYCWWVDTSNVVIIVFVTSWWSTVHSDTSVILYEDISLLFTSLQFFLTIMLQVKIRHFNFMSTFVLKSKMMQNCHLLAAVCHYSFVSAWIS